MDSTDNWQLCAYILLIQCENNGSVFTDPLYKTNTFCAKRTLL